ncbi:MAG: fructose-bisphosphate aldolase, partial [Gammaproteobacteria bacterium]|nr:fructose-bisphosphate aldolase [Gammaproteobacteria bacterium]
MTDIEALLGSEADHLLIYKATAIPKQDLHLPGSDFIERVMMNSDRSPTVLRNWQAMTGHG